ncbi:XdhC family protein [Actinoplanes regularis]|uniref:Xanthine dehydrogenase accessory factor n=1 Tax=Actinoplanes regularis TaxID=52697 RepID=A0A238ZXL9_9ACTN|nr:XdhC family protein [Actinoplanes regularis]GIE90213.1 carbon monoxide dehydrogenase F protein [Actinoplanes regularis]SNR87534.1 xanthine dehydrogenase accessory factor [Actinoplanes regularis]
MLSERASELVAARRPFVHATVVRAQEPTSARAGDDAVILADGSIEGFVGGVCTETSVRVAALDALEDGNSLLLRVLPEDAETFPETPGARIAINPCHSGGAVEIFLQPVLPRPLVAVQGSTPIGTAIRELAAFLDFEVAAAGFGGVTAAVVAGLGRDEEAALRGALDAGVPYIALIASRRRGAVVLDAMGLTDPERARIRTHPGLDISARTPKEIALSVLAEIVREMRTGGLAAPESPAAGPSVPLEMAAPRQGVDPICGMTVVIGPETPHAVVAGADYWYCCPGCLKKHTAA